MGICENLKKNPWYPEKINEKKKIKKSLKAVRSPSKFTLGTPEIFF